MKITIIIMDIEIGIIIDRMRGSIMVVGTGREVIEIGITMAIIVEIEKILRIAIIMRGLI